MATQFDPAEAVDGNVLENQYNEQAAQLQQQHVQHNDDSRPDDIKVSYGEPKQPDEEQVVNDEVRLVEETPDAPPVEPTVDLIEEEIIEVDGPAAPVAPPAEPKSDLPDIVQKFLEFHNDTGGGMNDYLNYTKDFDSLNDTQVLQEFYKLSKPHYTEDDINLLIKDKYGISDYEEGEEMSHEDRLKVLAMKDELHSAKTLLQGNREKYYADLKSGVHGAPEQYKEAVEFYDNAKKHTESTTQFREDFIKKSEKVFDNDFQGFPFEMDGKKYRLKVGNNAEVMKSQLDINDLLAGFVGEDGLMADTEQYHKAVWAATNADKIFYTAYEQGKADALKERAESTKNPDYNPQVGQSKPPTGIPKYKLLS